VARRLREFRVQLGLVAAFGFVVRLSAVLVWSRWFDPQGDQNFYWRQGQDLAQGYGFVYRNNFGERVATAVHPPLYSAYLGVVSVFGGTSHAWHRLASTLLGTAAVIVIALVARRLAGRRAGLIAAVLAAIYPNLWMNDAMMLSESMYALTIGLVVLAALRFRDRFAASDAVLLGGAVGLAALTRAEAAFLAVLLIVPLALLTRSQPWRARLLRGGAALAASAVVVAPWVVRNYVTFESHPVTLSNGSGFVVEISNCDQTYGLAAPTDAAGNPQPGESADKNLGYWAPECDRTPWPPGDETVVAAAKQKTGTDYIADHKRRFPVVVAARVGRIWDLWRPQQSYDFNRFFENRKDISVGADCLPAGSPSCTREGFGVTFSPVLVAMVMYYPMLVASIAGVVLLRRRAQTIAPFVAIAAMTTLTAAVSFGITRYRVGADVCLPILAAVAVDALVRRFRSDPADGAEPHLDGTDPVLDRSTGAGRRGPDDRGTTMSERGAPPASDLAASGAKR
jgi:hypothetical protein